MAKTNKQDIINNFSKYLGRKPTDAEISKYSTQDPATLIKDLTATKSKIESSKPKGTIQPVSQFTSAASTVATPQTPATMSISPTTTEKPQDKAPVTSGGASKQIYRDSQGNIFDAQTGVRISDINVLNRDYKGATEVPNPNMPKPEDINTKLRALGLSDTTISGMNEAQKQMFAGVGEVITKQYEQGNTVPQTFTTADLDALFQQAQNDPSINDYYKQQLNIGQEQFKQSVALQQQDYAALEEQQKRTNIEQQKALAEQQAAGGAAYSGFRQQAVEKLGKEQSGIIESSRRQAQKDVQTLGGQFEKDYGTEALKSAGIPTLYGKSYTPIGGVSGTLQQQKLTDIRAKEQELINKEALTRGLKQYGNS